MTWGDVEARVDQGEVDFGKELRQECARALDVNPVLEKYLRRVLQASTYSRGREMHDMTYAEGQRALARQLLQLGGKFDE